MKVIQYGMKQKLSLKKQSKISPEDMIWVRSILKYPNYNFLNEPPEPMAKKQPANQLKLEMQPDTITSIHLCIEDNQNWYTIAMRLKQYTQAIEYLQKNIILLGELKSRINNV